MRSYFFPYLLALFILGCNQTSKTNHFVIPTGYTGPIALVSDPTIESNGHWNDTHYLHLVPETAVVCVANDKILRPRFRLTAEYSDGSTVYTNYQGLPNPPTKDSVRLEAFGSWGGSIEDSEIHWFGIGTEDEVASLQGLFFGGGIEAKMPEGVVIDNWYNKAFKHLRPYCDAGR